MKRSRAVKYLHWKVVCVWAEDVPLDGVISVMRITHTDLSNHLSISFSYKSNPHSSCFSPLSVFVCLAVPSLTFVIKMISLRLTASSLPLSICHTYTVLTAVVCSLTAVNRAAFLASVLLHFQPICFSLSTHHVQLPRCFPFVPSVYQSLSLSFGYCYRRLIRVEEQQAQAQLSVIGFQWASIIFITYQWSAPLTELTNKLHSLLKLLHFHNFFFLSNKWQPIFQQADIWKALLSFQPVLHCSVGRYTLLCRLLKQTSNILLCKNAQVRRVRRE